MRLISASISWAKRRYNLGIQINPAFGVEKIRETPRSRYVTDREFSIQRDISANIAGYLPHFFDIAYLHACRQVEVRNFLLDDVTSEGLIVRRTKGLSTNMVVWSSTLHKAVLGCLEWHRKVHSKTDNQTRTNSAIRQKQRISELQISIEGKLIPLGYEDPVVAEWLIPSPQATQLSANTFSAAMKRLKNRMAENGRGNIYWTAHDLKRKGHTEAEDENLTGHKSEQMRQRYRVKARKVRPVK